MVLILVLAALVILYLVKLTGNAEIIEQNCRTDSDAVNVKAGQKAFYKTRESVILLVAGIISLILCVICHKTNLANWLIDYISFDFYEYKEFNMYFYLVPVYCFVIRGIIAQVKIGDFLYKYFNVKEPELDMSVGDIVKSLLYKKKPDSTVKSNGENNEVSENKNESSS